MKLWLPILYVITTDFSDTIKKEIPLQHVKQLTLSVMHSIFFLNKSQCIFVS